MERRLSAVSLLGVFLGYETLSCIPRQIPITSYHAFRVVLRNKTISCVPRPICISSDKQGTKSCVYPAIGKYPDAAIDFGSTGDSFTFCLRFIGFPAFKSRVRVVVWN